MSDPVRQEIGPNWTAPEDRAITGEVVGCADAFERSIGKDLRDRFEHFYRLYRGFKQFRNAWEAASPRERDGVVYDAKQQWGANLHIPLSFRTVEEMVPRAIAHRPRMLYMPRDERWEQNVVPVRLLIDSQQEQIDIELEYQDVMRSGMIYGIGAGKVFWRREYAARRKVMPQVFRGGYALGRPTRELSFDDPDFENVDVFDLMWDQYGSDVRTCGWIIHRSWLSLPMCLERIQSGAWNTASAKLLDEDKLRQLGGSAGKYDEVWQQRMEASGLPGFQTRDARGEQIHELLEWHNGEDVYCTLDRQVTVQNAENPCFGRIPFMIYRPTKLPNQFVGIGEIEPIEHLNRELDTLRSQRRDAATLALCAGYAYDDNAVDLEDLQFGPAAAIPIRNADVREALMPLARQDVPGSGYQEEQVIRQDFMDVSGLSAQDGPGGSIGTATEAQLVQAAVSKRIELKSRRFEVEVVRSAARCFLLLDQRMILENRRPLRQPDAGLSLQEAAAVGRWKWVDIGPGELRGEYEIIPEGGSMAAANVPQRRQDAVQTLQLFGGNEYVDPKRPILRALELFDIKDPESWLKQQDPPIPPEVLDNLVKMGVNPEAVQWALKQAQQQDPQLQGPTPDEVGGMMQGQPVAA